MLSTADISKHFLSLRNKNRKERALQKTPDLQSEEILSKTNKSNKSNKLNNNKQYRNNISNEDFEYILKKQLVYELDDYKTNYSYKQANNVDPEFKYNLKLQDGILDFFNDNFYNKNNIYKFMRLINETFENAIRLFIKEYKLDDDDIRMVFYNDIVLRKIAEKFIYTLPNKSSINISSYFDKYFNSELLEWCVVLHPELENYEKIYSKLKFYIARVMKQLNTYITINKREIFDYFKYNDAYLQYINLKLSSQIEELLNNLKEYNHYNIHYQVEKTNLVKNVHTYRHSTSVLLNNNSNKHLFQINIVENENEINYSQCISFHISLKNTEFKNKTKAKNYEQSILVPIPIMSISLRDRNDYFSKKMIQSAKNVRKYTYVFSLDDIFEFEGLSFKFICEHLESNAYDEEPWITQNWKNIYGRLMFFYLIDLFANIRSNRIRNSIVTLSKKYIDLIKDINKEFSKGDDKEMERIYEMLLRKYDDSLNVKLITLIKNIHKYNQTYKYNVKFKEFVNFIDDILNVIENIFRSVFSYCTQSNDVFEENLYKGDIKYVI